MLQGPLLQLLIIQTQYMKRELLRQMSAMDTLLRQNFFTASMSALLPGALAIGSTLVVLLGASVILVEDSRADLENQVFTSRAEQLRMVVPRGWRAWIITRTKAPTQYELVVDPATQRVVLHAVADRIGRRRPVR